jgi:putative chitinase
LEFLLLQVLPAAGQAVAQGASASKGASANNSKVAAAQKALRAARKDTLQTVRKNFKEFTGCEVKITSSLEGSYRKGSTGEFIVEFFKNLFNSKASLNDAITINVDWKGVGTEYEIDKMVVETDKAPKGLFADDALKTFSKTLQAYKETIAGIEDSKVDKVIIAALQNLQLQKNTFTDSTFVCTECGRNLSITWDRLQFIFINNETMTHTHVDYLNHALKEGGFTTCKRHAHFFSQVFHESDNFTKFRENHHYRLTAIYTTFHKQSNGSHTTLFSQTFWDNNQHLNYIGVKDCEYLYEKNQRSSDIPNKSQRIKGVGNVTYKHAKHTSYFVTLPENFTQDTGGVYRRYTAINSTQNGQNLFNLVYNGLNGNIANSNDGWTYLGRGAIQLTGRGNYRKISNLCNDKFKTSFDWENNPDDVATKDDAIIYSAVGWFMDKYNPISQLDKKTAKEVTKAVNAGGIDEDKRVAQFNSLMNNLYKCEPKKK